MLQLLIPALAPILERLIPDAKERERVAGEIAQAASAAEARQAEITGEAGRSSSFYVAGPRPTALWLAVIGFGYVIIGQPLGNWLLQVIGLIFGQAGLPALPTLDKASIDALLFGLLGLGGLRTFEKAKGVARERL